MILSRFSQVVLGVALLALPGAGSAQNTFVLEEQLPVPTTSFNVAVAMSGNTVVVGARNETVGGNATQGAAYVFVRSGTGWAQQARLDVPAPGAADYNFGAAVDIDGDTIVVGAPLSPSFVDGRAFVFVRSGTTWALQATLAGQNTASPSDNTQFGSAVSVAGNTVMVGARGYDIASTGPGFNAGAVYVFERTGTTWGPFQRLTPPDATAVLTNFSVGFGTAIDISGSAACVGAKDAASATLGSGGAVYTLVRGTSGWVVEQTLRASSPQLSASFGFDCAIAGDTLLVGSPGLREGVVPPSGVPTQGGADAYVKASGTWSLQQQLRGGQPTGVMGWSVGLIEGRAIVGAPGTRGANGVTIPPAVLVFDRSGTVWTETQRLPSPAAATFGEALDVHSNSLAVGSAGSLYLFTPTGAPPPPPTPTAPGAPSNVQATATGNTLNLTWGAPTSGGAPTSYTLVARTAPGAAPIQTVPLGATTSFAATAPNGTFLLSLTATNAVGTGPESAAVTVTFPGGTIAPPASPTGLGASVAGTTATFTWTAPASGGAPAGYVLQAGTSPAFTTPIAALPVAASPTSYSMPGVPPGTYYVRLVAQNAGGTSAPSNEVTVTVAGASAPGAPTLSASASGSTVNVSWSAGGGGTPTGYTLSASTSPGGAPIATLPVSGTSAAFTSVPGGTYYLTLTASNGAGTSPPSNQVTVTVP